MLDVVESMRWLGLALASRRRRYSAALRYQDIAPVVHITVTNTLASVAGGACKCDMAGISNTTA